MESEIDKTEVYLRYLPRSATEAHVRELLKDAGTIRRVWMSKDAQGECKGFAFVNFSKNKEARECVMHYNTHPKNYLDGKHVVIEHAKAWEGNAEKKIAACSYGLECTKPDCWFTHPAGWAFAKTTGTRGDGKGSGKKNESGGKDGGVRDKKVRKKVRSKTRLGAKARQRAKKRAEKEAAAGGG
jgi:RNA recognition motif-containing protein